jgi:hypothetical protein
VLLEVRQQLRETGAAGGSGGFNVNEFFRDDDIALLGVFAEKALLCRDAEPFLFLVSALARTLGAPRPLCWLLIRQSTDLLVV